MKKNIISKCYIIRFYKLVLITFKFFFYSFLRSNRGYSYRFTQIAVDPQVKTPGGKTYDVLFIGTDNGKVIKAVNAESADTHLKVSPVVIEEIQAFPSTVPVRGIKVVRASQAGDGLEDGRLVVIADSQVQALRLHRCYSDRILSCGECVALQDPYCAWDKVEGKCRALVGPAATDASRFLQSVATGLHASCPPSKSLNKDAGSVGAISANQNKFPPDSMIPNKEGQGGEIINIMQDEEQDNSGRDIYIFGMGEKLLYSTDSSFQFFISRIFNWRTNWIDRRSGSIGGRLPPTAVLGGDAGDGRRGWRVSRSVGRLRGRLPVRQEM